MADCQESSGEQPGGVLKEEGSGVTCLEQEQQSDVAVDQQVVEYGDIRVETVMSDDGPQFSSNVEIMRDQLVTHPGIQNRMQYYNTAGGMTKGATVIEDGSSIMMPQNIVSPGMGHDYSQPQEARTTIVISRENLPPHLESAEVQVVSEDGVTVGSEDVITVTSHTGNIDISSASGLHDHTDLSGPGLADMNDAAFCLICSDKGSGYHYSVFSCEGCKGFFKRTVQKNLNYTCKENQDCVVNKFTRNNCQYCRFQKCIAVGMKREAVREDRTPGGKHRHKRIRVDDEDGMADAGVYRALQLDADSDEDDLVQKLIDARPDLIPSTTDIFSGGSQPPDQGEMDINDLMQYGYMELRMIIEWARKVPGFSELLIEDQMALLKSSFMELNVLRLAYRSLDLSNGVRFGESIALSPEEGAHIGWGKDLINYTLEFIGTMREISIDHSEFCVLNAIILTYPDAIGIQDKKSVSQLQSTFLDALRKYSLNTYQSEPRRYPRILLRLPTLRALSSKAAERFLSMSLDGSIKMNSLVLEMMS